MARKHQSTVGTPAGQGVGHTVVVGVDGSERSTAALEWAAAHAGAMGAEVRAVTAWHFPDVLGHHPARMESDLSANLERLVEHQADQACHDVPHHTVVQEDSPAHLLLREAKGADLLVVGRGRAPSLGSVTKAVLAQASCPVVVVPHRPTETRD